MSKEETIIIKISPELKLQLKVMAEISGVSMSEKLRELVFIASMNEWTLDHTFLRDKYIDKDAFEFTGWEDE